MFDSGGASTDATDPRFVREKRRRVCPEHWAGRALETESHEQRENGGMFEEAWKTITEQTHMHGVISNFDRDPCVDEGKGTGHARLPPIESLFFEDIW